jgi:zinc protease
MLRRLTALLTLTAAPLIAEPVTTFTLDNGMEVVVIEDRRAPAVTHMVWYRAGAADEPGGSSGVAHFLEHLMFKGTATLAPGEFSATVAANGGDDNAFTSWDYTAYFQRVATDRLGLMMQMEADRMINLRLTEAEVLTERQVILEERDQRTESDPNAIAREQVRAALFLNHRYGQPIIGWQHEMEALDMDDVLAWYDLYYSPNNATLVVAGDVSPDEVRALAEEIYGPIPAEPNLPPRIRAQEPPQRSERRLIYADPRVSQDYLTRSYIAPARDPGDQTTAAALVYLAELLGGSSFTSLLGERLTFDQNIALYTGAGYDGANLDDGTFSVTVLPAEGVTLQEAEDAMDAVLAEFLETGPDPDDMERIRTQLRASEIYALDNVESTARRYGAALSQSLTVQDVQDWPRLLQEVTADDVMAAARTVLNRNASVTAWIVADREGI